MKIKEVLDELSMKGNTVAKIAKNKAKIGEKKLKEALHNTGYEYHNKNPKVWFYAGEGEQPLYQSVFEFINVQTSLPVVKQDSPRKPQVNSLDVKSVRNEGEHNVHTGFTPEEVAILRDLIRIYVLDEQHKENQGDRDDLYQRVITLEKKGDKVRKTIVINREVGSLLDKFADQQKFNKSDLIEIAILDLIKKYQ
ncbi:hypothetical protein JFV29_13300 [Peribacillus sp. TH16]|uniref:hypothetical protein n=2 Tax=unclassified Peribacillus TaxID=2675266 RepID=UPI001913E693|nr:hypothetical protein [Peribacillus sp. TH16]MBK5482850.1 hypothetical protein [Peribacillus sp. TH16]